MNYLNLLRDLAPYATAVIAAGGTYISVERKRKEDRVKAEKEAEDARAERLATANTLEGVRQGKDAILESKLMELVQRIAQETIEKQQARMNELEDENTILRGRVRELEIDNSKQLAQIDQLRGEVAQLKQVIQSAARIGVAPGT